MLLSCEAFAIEFGQLSLISGSDEVAIVDFYISCFREEDRTGSFFVKLVMKASRITPLAKRPVGKNTISSYGKRIATMLRLENPDGYTGHCWRRTATTLCAEAGLSIPQMKAVTGHRSDTVLQGYIDNSILMKRKALITINFINSTLTAQENAPLVNFAGASFSF